MPDLRQECKDTISMRLGRALTPQESRQIIPSIRAQMAALRLSDPARWEGMTRDERVSAAADRVAEGLSEHAKQMRYRARLAIVKAEQVQTTYRNNSGRGLYGYRSVGNILEATYTYARGVQQQYFSRIASQLKKAINPRFMDLFEDKANAYALVQELHGEDSGNAVAKTAAGVISQTFEAMRVRFNRAGGDVGLLEDWALPQPHDADRVARAASRLEGGVSRRHSMEQNREAWVNFVIDKLDTDKYIDENSGEKLTKDQLRDMLVGVWETLVTDGNGDQFGSRVANLGSQSRANRYGQHRALHFKDAASYMEYEQKFGTGTIMATIADRIRSMSKDIGLLEQLGPNPTNTFKTLSQIAAQDLERARLTDGAIKRAWKYRDLNGALGVTTKQMWAVLTGETARPAGTGRLAAFGQGVRNLQVAGKLGSALISSFSDVPTYFIALGVNRIHPLEASFSLLKAFSREDAEYAARAGILADDICSTISRWGEENVGRGWTGILADTTIRMSLLDAWTKGIRRAFSLNLMAATGKLARRKKWSELDAYDRQRLERHGFMESDWLVLRLASPERYKGCEMLTRAALEAIPESTLKNYGLTASARDATIAKWLAMIQDESYMASLEPDLATRTAASRGTQAGTISGEFWRSFMLFKSFPFAMITRHFGRGRDLWESGHQGAAVAYGAAIIIGTGLFGALSLQAANLLSGRDLQDPTKGEFWGAALMKGGGLGVFGDMLYNGIFAESSYGSPNVLSFLGPVAGSAFDTWDVFKTAFDSAAYDKNTKWQQKALRLVRGNTPFVNIWYAKLALDHAVFSDLNELCSPGYLRRQRNRAKRTQGQGYWWPQNRVLPERLPRVAKAPR